MTIQVIIMNKIISLTYRVQQFSQGARHFCTIPKVKKSSNESTNEQQVLSVGQPTYRSHPHLMKRGEILPLITSGEFQQRRQKLVESIMQHTTKNSKKTNKHIIVIPSATKQYMSDKIPYVFHQNTEFMYLSGCMEPDCCLVLTNADTPSQHLNTLFVRDKDSHSELWDGPRTAPSDAVTLFGIDTSLHINDLSGYLYSLTRGDESVTVWYDFLSKVQPNVDRIMQEFVRETTNRIVDSPNKFVHTLRLFKSSAEIGLMQKTCDIASEAFIETISASKPGTTEHEMFAKMDYECRTRGANYLAYPPVVAGGNRANTIHYIDNNNVVHNGEMVLMDAGSYYYGFCSDITRTWPINGKFTPAQRTLYEAVLDVQSKLISMCTDVPHLDSLFDEMCKLLGKNLQEIGVISSDTSKDNLSKIAYSFCPHHVSHYLGMDVHDTPTVRRNLKLQPGMVITVEPGVYVSRNANVPTEFKGLGIRIEDDILITDSGPVVLTKRCPKQIDDIEKIASINV